MCGLQTAKDPYAEWWPFVQGYKLPSTPVPCCKSIALFFKPLAPPPHPSLPLIQPLDPTHTSATQFLSNQKTRLSHQNSLWSDTQPILDSVLTIIPALCPLLPYPPSSSLLASHQTEGLSGLISSVLNVWQLWVAGK